MFRYLIILCLFVLIVSCNEDCLCPNDNYEIKIGVLISLSGYGSSTGESTAEALNIANDEINSYLSSIKTPYRIKLIFENTQTDTSIVLDKAKALASQGCKVIIGPYSSAELSAIKKWADDYGYLIISPSSVSISLAIPNDNIFRFAPNDETQAKAITKMLKEDKIETIIPIVRDDLWGNDLLNATTASFTQAGGKVLNAIKYNPNNFNQENYIEYLTKDRKSVV